MKDMSIYAEWMMNEDDTKNSSLLINVASMYGLRGTKDALLDSSNFIISFPAASAISDINENQIRTIFSN